MSGPATTVVVQRIVGSSRSRAAVPVSSLVTDAGTWGSEERRFHRVVPVAGSTTAPVRSPSAAAPGVERRREPGLGRDRGVGAGGGQAQAGRRGVRGSAASPPSSDTGRPTDRANDGACSAVPTPRPASRTTTTASARSAGIHRRPADDDAGSAR